MNPLYHSLVNMKIYHKMTQNTSLHIPKKGTDNSKSFPFPFSIRYSPPTIIIFMFKILKYSFSLAELKYHEFSLPIIEPFLDPKSTESPLLFNFQQSGTMTFMQKILPKTKTHESLIELYLNFIQSRQKEPKHIAYQYLQQNLRKKVYDELTRSQGYVREVKMKMIQSQLIERAQILGLFIHRKFNLNLQSYEYRKKRSKSHIYELKPALRKDAVKAYDAISRQYTKSNMMEIYGKEMTKFITETPINRYLYEMILDLELTVQRKGAVVKLGGNGPTKHLVQIESIFNYYSNIQDFYLTDVDFILKGNPYFKERFRH